MTASERFSCNKVLPYISLQYKDMVDPYYKTFYLNLLFSCFGMLFAV